MKGIKLRAWDKINKKMYLPQESSQDVVIQLSGVVGLFNKDIKMYSVVNFIIERYTGLKDKNYKEICEGDVVCFSSFMDEKKGLYVVVCKSGSFGVEPVFPNLVHPDDVEYKPFYKDGECDSDSYIVMGNTHENTELMEEK